LDAYRALDNPKFILLDEADFFRKSEQEDVRHVSDEDKDQLEEKQEEDSVGPDEEQTTNQVL
jgi:hypothetical protein